jgi:hypothetical protein
MSSGAGRAAVIGAAAMALAAGAAAGWLAARSTVPPPPPPPVYVNPLADAKKDEVLVWGSPDGATEAYRVLEGSHPQTVLLSVETVTKGGPSTTRQFRVARSFFGTFIILDGDIPPDLAEASLRDFVIEKAEHADLRVESLDRTFRCLRISGTYQNKDPRVYWVTDELPVHGIARIEGNRGVRYEVKSFSFGPGR